MGRRNEFDPSALESLFPEAAKDKKEEGSSVTDILLDDILPVTGECLWQENWDLIRSKQPS